MSIGTLIHRHPMRSAASAMLDAERALDQIQRDFSHYPRAGFGARRSAAPRIDARENETGYTISAELPGVDGNELDISIEEGVLTLRRVVEVVSQESRGEEQKDEQKEAQSERQVVFERRIRFNGEIDEEGVKAAYKNGLLTVTVPKPEVVQPEVRTIPVEVG